MTQRVYHSMHASFITGH